jgi:hypothetical protein
MKLTKLNVSCPAMPQVFWNKRSSADTARTKIEAGFWSYFVLKWYLSFPEIVVGSYFRFIEDFSPWVLNMDFFGDLFWLKCGLFHAGDWMRIESWFFVACSVWGQGCGLENGFNVGYTCIMCM